MRSNPQAKARLLAVCTTDVMAWLLLRPWLRGLQDRGYEVHLACARGQHFDQLAAEGFRMHAVSLRRSFAPWVHVRPIFELYALMRRGHFDIVNTHSPVAGALGRLAAWLAGTRPVVYTVHGFYFHENMPTLPRWHFIALEWLIGRATDGFMFVSEEDRVTARRTGIASDITPAITIYNGVDLRSFSPKGAAPESARLLRQQHGLDEAVPVVGIVGRIVREKGHREFLSMAREISVRHRVVFLVVGDTLNSDRDQFGATFRKSVADAGLASSFIFTGQTDRVADYLQIMDMFILPSYREGFPRSIVEAMACGLPVIATNIRGCREAVLHGETGLIVQPRDPRALTEAVERLLKSPDEALRMGRAGRARAVKLYDSKAVADRFVIFIDEVSVQKSPAPMVER